MILGSKMFACLSIVLCTVLIQNVCGTFFPPVENPPPIPSQAARNLNSPQQSSNPPQELPRDFSEARERDFFPSDAILNEQRFYFEERQPEESRNRQSSSDRFEDYYLNGERSIGPVATPIPDDAYSAQSSSISNSNPTNFGSASNSGIYIENPEGWVEIQIPSERLVGNVKQDSGLPVATDTVKSVVAPAPFGIPPNPQLPPNPAINIVQVRPSNVVELQKIYRNIPRTVDSIPSVKQVAGVPPLPPFSTKSIVQEIINDVPPVAVPPPAQISSKKSFAVPPPLPPPLKGVDTPPNIISSVPINVIPDSNVVISSKNSIPDSSIISGKSVVEQVRHVWIPTSAKTGKFITIPVSGSVNSRISDINKGFSLDSTPITVSDTWILKQDGPVPVFEKQKSALAPVSSPIVQSGKVIFENPTIVQVDGPPNQVVAKVNSPKIPPPVIEKTVSPKGPIDIWPARKEITSPKVLESYSPVFTPVIPPAPVKSSAAVIGKYSPELLPTPQKTIVTDTKAFLPPIPPQPVQVVNGKPCPLPLPSPQKSFYSPLNSGLISVPSIITTQRRLPYARIIRVNRYPTGSYYLLNRSVRPSYFAYPSQAIIQQPKTGLINIIQNRQIPQQFQGKIPLPPVKSKQISVPIQSKQIAYSLPAKQLAYPYVSRQVLLPITSPKSTRIVYPTAQAIRYAYPWNAYLASNPKFGNGAYAPEFSSFRLGSKESESSSSEVSSENSSSESSSESSKEKREEKSKKGKPKTEEKSKSVENSSSNESGKESESEVESKSKSKEIETEDESPELESKESPESTESEKSE